MKALSAMSAGIGLLVVVVVMSGNVADAQRWVVAPPGAVPPGAVPPVTQSFAPNNDVVRQYCERCHNDSMLLGNMSLEHFDVAAPEDNAELAEKMIRKLRTGMMPPPGAPRPAGDTLVTLVEALERRIDVVAADNPNPGGRTFQRLNRAEYAASVRDLLGLDVDAGAFLPLDTKSENFDNIADVQLLSPTLLDAYLNAAAEISRLAVGDPDARPSERTYTVSGYTSQRDRVPGAPFGTRGGVSVSHTFPADGEYVFRVGFEHTTTGAGFFGQITRFEQLDVSVDGERVALLDVDQWMRISDPEGIAMRTEPIFVRAGSHRVTAAFIERSQGPVEDLMSPHDWSLADRHTGISGYGLTLLPHVRDLVIGGPFNVTGVSESQTRALIFTCRPSSPDQARPCAEQIFMRLGTKAYRRPLTPRDLEALMSFYDDGAVDGFENGVRIALQALLASPHFVFRLEEAPSGIGPGATYRINDTDLASRLSFFLWGTPPDDELISLAVRGDLSNRAELEAQVHRMLADVRSQALGSRFAGQWLRLQDLDKIHPDSFWFPDFDQQLADAMRRETESFFSHLVRNDRSVLDLYQADYTFLNERLAKHYGIPGVTGGRFRETRYPDDRRRGILGHGSILTLTSHADRTSPVLRGKWVMEVLLGSPPPPPPPGIPDLDETGASEDGRFLTTRERMELHRASPSCNSCHRFMDPIGLALDNFDVTGKWRIRENGAPVDTQGELYDGTPLAGPADLRRALLKRPIPLVRTFTENLMAYALGRRVEYFDQPTIRAIIRAAAPDGYLVSSLIIGIVNSDAFQMQRVDGVADEPGENERH
ncbi:MAG: DUF1592 domain-containing protein [Candidatus Palauibacterales bacterium]|nr:DUF1592 domain-containing protein [Candidatus Palauibacterales bacterium]